ELAKGEEVRYFEPYDDSSDTLKATFGGSAPAFRTYSDRWGTFRAVFVPELSPKHRAQIALGSQIAVPGCHASGMIALVYPLMEAGLLPKDANLCFTSITGYTGGGKRMIAEYETKEMDRPACYNAPRQYALSQSHKHLPEVNALCGLTKGPVFLPIVGDFPRGMAVTLPLHAEQLRKTVSPELVWETLSAHYAGSPVVKLLPLGAEAGEGGFFAANALAHRDGMELLVTGNEERMLLHARFDNLGKGASGAALQCMNIMLGLDETTSLAL
ncbi:MAG: N-acetyl-gamma-glutamyl-phosphate reductase, partial [Clostridia bacterium]|nr:N-acetyl-gamma-glutamyl-phosphate reductase [Clostridia bacterium]